MGLDPHHGMDAFGQIPDWENVTPPGAEEHHLTVKPSKGPTSCNPMEYPSGSGKMVPAHKHPGAYNNQCHPVTAKHHAGSKGEAWHNTHQADIDQTWQQFNDQQGLEGDTTPGTFDQDDVYPLWDAPSEEVVPPVTTPEDKVGLDLQDLQDLQVGSKLNYYGTNLEAKGVGEYTIVLADENGKLYNFSPSELANDANILLDDDVPDVDVEPEVPSDDSPENLQVGTTITGSNWKIEITDISPNGDFSTSTYNSGYMKPGETASGQYGKETFIKWFEGEMASTTPPQVEPPNIPTGDVVNETNPHELQVGTTVSYSTPDWAGGVLITDIKITAISDDSVQFTTSTDLGDGGSWDGEKSLESFNEWVTDTLTNQEMDATVQHPGLNDIPNPQSPPIPTGSMDDPYTEEYLNTLPKMGESVSDVDTLVSFPPGTQFMAETGQVVTLLEVKQGLNADGNEVLTNYHLNLGELGDVWFNGDEWPSGFGKTGYEPVVSQLSPDVSSAMDKGFQLGQSIIPSTLDMLPVGLAFTVAGKTFTITENNSAAFQNVKPGTGIKVSTVDENGTTYPEVPLDQNIIDALTGTADGKIVALPSGIASQQATTAKAPAFNKHGLDKGTKVDVKNWGGEVNSGTITKTHKTKAGQNYTIEWDDAYGHKKIKVKSSNFEDPESDPDKMGYFVTDAIHKEGMEPDDDPLELPPLGSEPGNFDDVLEKIGGKLGYNEGGTFEHKQTGQKFYIKFSSSGSDEQVKSEALANNLYELLGISTLGTSLITFDNKTALKSTWNPNLETIPISQMSKEAGILDSFVADAWLANWDVIGPNNDNTQKYGDKIVKIDSGGALAFGGAGGPKPFTATVNEIESMQDPNKAKVAYQVFQNIPTEHLVTGAQKLAKVTDAHIDAIVDNSQISNKENMKEVLKARRDALVGKLLNESHTAASEGLSHPGQHKHEGGKGWHAEGLEHGGKKANEAHEKLGLPFTAPKKYIGSTLEPGQDFFTTVANSTTIPAQYKTLINKALAADFNASDATGRRQKIAKFLAENNIADTFSSNFNSWQSGGYYIGNIRVAAALFELKGEADAVRASQANHWGWTMGQTHHFEESWDSGTADALALVPYIVSSQQYVKSLHGTGQFTVHRGLSNSGANKVGSLVQNAMKKIPDDKKKNWVGQFPGGSPAVAAGWSENLSTSKGFGPAALSGIIFKKTIKAEDVLLHFKAFSASFGGEDEVIIDPNSARKFSYDEILKGGIDYK